MIKRISLAIAAVIFSLLLLPSSVFAAHFSGDDKITVVLDPGHGGSDPGSMGTQYESYYNLKVASYCAEALKKNGNFDVRMTRSTQTEPLLTLAQRGVYADSVNADLIVSIHFNSSTSSAPNGVEVYTSVLPRFDMKGLGNSIASKLSSATGLRSKGCFRQYDHGSTLYYWSDKYQWDIPGDSSVGGLSDYFGIITWAAKFGFPGIIIEHAYLSNPNDLAVADKEENLRKMGEADAEAIINYYTGHDHSYAAEYTVDYPVSCFSAGKQSVHCTVCGHRKDVRPVASAPDPEKHLWLSEDVVPATCYAPGSANYYCRYTHNLIDKGCTQFEEHTKYNVLPQLSHSYSVTFYQELTHTQDGITTYTCSNCGDSYTETIQAEGHSFELVSERDASCTESGGEFLRCSKCGYEIFNETSPALGHDLEEISSTEADCENEGITEYECTVCGEHISETAAPLGHDYEQISIKETSEGTETEYRCQNCGKEYTDFTSLKCEHDFHEVSYTESGCESEGLRVIRCSKCGKEEEEIIAPIGHDWGEGVSDKKASLFGSGTVKYVCRRDSSHVRMETLPSWISVLTGERKALLLAVSGAVILIAAAAISVCVISRKRKNAKAESAAEVSESSYEASAGSSEENALNENDSCNGENNTLSESEEASADDAEEVKQD